MVATAFDTNVLVTLLSAAEADVRRAHHVLEETGVLGELLAAPLRDEAFLRGTRILAAFLIVAHAAEVGARSLTFDGGVFKAAFLELTVVAPPTC